MILSMIRNYLKTAWRNISRSKGYSALNILGLATGMAVTLLIGLWVNNEWSFNQIPTRVPSTLPGKEQLQHEW